MKIYFMRTSHYELGEDTPLKEGMACFLDKANAEKWFDEINPVGYTTEIINKSSACKLKICKSYDKMKSFWVRMYELETED